MKSRRKMNLILIIFVIVIILGLGYAYLTTTLNINGTTNVDSNSWNIYWDNVQVSSGSVTGSQVTQAPTIDTNKTTVSFQVRLSKLGDYYEFTVDAKNAGSIDAMIETITKTTSIPAYLKYTVTYDDDVEIEENHKLNANSTQKYKVRVEYRTEINANQLPSTSQSTTLTFGLTYVQADSNAVVKPYYRYSNYGIFNYYENGMFLMGSQPPSAVPLYSSYTDQDLLNKDNTANNILLRHLMRNNIVLDSNPCYVRNNKTICVKAHNYSELTAEEKEIIISSFGQSNCNEGSDYFVCSDPNIYFVVGLDDNMSQVIGYIHSDIWFCAYMNQNNVVYSICSFM